MKTKAQMGAGTVVILVIVGILLVSLFAIIGMYNGLVSKDVGVSKSWGNVETAYQRRADLIPNYMATVAGAATFEKSTQEDIAKLRTDATQLQQDTSIAKTPAALQSTDAQMPALLGRVNVVVEAYPDLKATTNFQGFQDELAGTENRIKFERDNYNSAVQSYQIGVRSFPTNIIAGMYGFSVDKWKMFQSTPGAETAPKVSFNITG